MVNTQPRLPMRAFFWDLLSLSLEREFDIHGLLRNVKFSCGLWLTKDVGLLIGCRNGDSHTLTIAQEFEDIDHLLVGCVFSRQFWYRWLGQVNLQGLTPQPGDRSTIDWKKASDQLQGRALLRKGSIPLSSWGSGHFGTTGTAAFLRCSLLMLLRPLGKLRRNWSCGRWQGPIVFLS
jgi:hypothetical protein